MLFVDGPSVLSPSARKRQRPSGSAVAKVQINNTFCETRPLNDLFEKAF